jgi:prepilin-type processing-associated H-X9-DG protein
MAYLAAGVRSRHEGGANAVAVDGHVVFLSNSIHPVVFAYLVSINDGQFLMPNYSPIR